MNQILTRNLSLSPLVLRLKKDNEFKSIAMLKEQNQLLVTYFTLKSHIDCIMNLNDLFFKVKWFKNNKQITESDRYEFKSDDENGIYSLIIPTCLSTDDGQYHISASNSNGEVIAAYSVIISYDALSNADANSIDLKQIIEQSSSSTTSTKGGQTVVTTTTSKRYSSRTSTANLDE